MTQDSSSFRVVGKVFSTGGSRAIRIPRALWELGLTPSSRIAFDVSREGEGWLIRISPIENPLFNCDLFHESSFLATRLLERGEVKESMLVDALVGLIQNPHPKEGNDAGPLDSEAGRAS